MADLIAFLSHRRGRYIDRSKFPDAVLNGMALDLFGLYKEVVTRGGFRCVGGGHHGDQTTCGVIGKKEGEAVCVCGLGCVACCWNVPDRQAWSS